MKFQNTLTGEVMTATEQFATDENTRLMIQHKAAVWTRVGLWKPIESDAQTAMIACPVCDDGDCETKSPECGT